MGHSGTGSAHNGTGGDPTRIGAIGPTGSEETTMGKGDLRTRRGKIYNGSYGKKRPHRAPKKSGEARPGVRRPPTG
jgi:ribosomal small subunit protein bTHX